ncbi:PEP/pyruvate-binding domain-containing protein [Streptomyces sp. NPDC058246]|uniref:PEP/pyruvate-binding domain-containing protein n=1 Tax=Streptomyces sp. NPDC058246 TaxID=3346400 RepID=UPI0036E2E8DD
MSSVLFVHAFGGPPLDYTLPRVAAHAEVHMLAVSPLPEAYQDVPLPYCASVRQVTRPKDRDDIVEVIVQHARELGCDAVLTLSECAVVAVARACQALHLAGPGPQVQAARNKHMMRAAWHAARVPQPAFAVIDDDSDVPDAFASLRPPLLLKPVRGAGPGAYVKVYTVAEALRAVRHAPQSLRKMARLGYTELGSAAYEEREKFLLEEIAVGTTYGWFEQPGWGDQVSVEGIVAQGTYHPLCISGRLPTVMSFTKRASVSPVALQEDLQRSIERTARRAVDALRLETCAVHTTLKLGPSGARWVLGTAARPGNALTMRQVEEVFGLDMIGMLVQQLLGRPVTYPPHLLTEGEGAAASLAVVPFGEMRPWQQVHAWDFPAVSWPALLSPGATCEPVPELSLPDGFPVPAYDPTAGNGNTAAVCFLKAPDVDTLMSDCGRIVREVEDHLPQAQPAPGADVLDMPRFRRLSGILAGRPYVKVVVDRDKQQWHVLDSTEYALHTHYIAERILGKTWADVHTDLEALSHSVYQDPERRFLLGVLCWHPKAADQSAEQRQFMVLETVGADTMGRELLTEFYTFVRRRLDETLSLFLKPANHGQEQALADVPHSEVPRIAWHQLYTDVDYAALNVGETCGRLRFFASDEDYRKALQHGGIDSHDILAMPVIPDGIPRVAGLISGLPTAPLSHTNVLAAGWDIPNAVVRDIAERVGSDQLDGAWVRYSVTLDGAQLSRADEPADTPTPQQSGLEVFIGTPRMERLDAAPLSQLRADDRVGYGTKAAHLGELHHVLREGSAQLTDFYAQPRPPAAHLLDHLAERLGAPGNTPREQLAQHAAAFLAGNVQAPEGVALPFAWQERFLARSPNIQQRIGMLKMALELDAFEAVDTVCAELRILVRHTPLPDEMLHRLHDILVRDLPGTSPLVVRSSSNAEDLPGFSAAGLYESVPHVSGEAGLADAVRRVWASLFSSRSVRLRHQAGIPPADTYMGVIVHRRHEAAYGGVMVTCNTTRPDDYRHVSVNLTPGSPERVVTGRTLPIQHLYNTVEGGGRTLNLGDAEKDVDASVKEHLSHLALAGRLLQGHFQAGPHRNTPLDIEWLLDPTHQLHLLQIRSFAARTPQTSTVTDSAVPRTVNNDGRGTDRAPGPA